MTDKLFIAFNITCTYDLLLQGLGDRDSIYDCTRHYWANVNLEKAELADFALGVAHGKVVGVFKPERWYYTEPENRKSRIQFEGEEIPDSPYLGMDLSEYFDRIQNPVRYIGKWNGHSTSFSTNTTKSHQKSHLSTKSLNASTKLNYSPEIELKLKNLKVGCFVKHKKFGEGEITDINVDEKFILILYPIGEKKFVYPDAFHMGFLEMD